ncbi:MAG: hypothetical protein OXF68_11540 [Gammaproteobacteria bacterium]|nr:hypothetical protein [Gammaproteobacteria bacterium]
MNQEHKVRVTDAFAGPREVASERPKAERPNGSSGGVGAVGESFSAEFARLSAEFQAEMALLREVATDCFDSTDRLLRRLCFVSAAFCVVLVADLAIALCRASA